LASSLQHCPLGEEQLLAVSELELLYISLPIVSISVNKFADSEVGSRDPVYKFPCCLVNHS